MNFFSILCFKWYSYRNDGRFAWIIKISNRSHLWWFAWIVAYILQCDNSIIAFCIALTVNVVLTRKSNLNFIKTEVASVQHTSNPWMEWNFLLNISDIIVVPFVMSPPIFKTSVTAREYIITASYKCAADIGTDTLIFLWIGTRNVSAAYFLIFSQSSLLTKWRIMVTS